MSSADAGPTPPGVHRLGRVIGGSGPAAARVVGALEGAARERNRATARMLRAVHEAGRAVDGAEPLSRPDQFSDDEVAACLGWSRSMAGRWIDLAADLCGRLPAVLDAMSEGDLDEAKARALSDWTRDLAEDHARAVVAQVLPDAPRLTVAELICWIQELAIALDPEWAARREARARTRARVVGGINPSGTAYLAGRDLPVDEVIAALARVEALAVEVRAAGVEVPISRIRSVVYLRLLHGGGLGVDDATLVDALVGELAEPSGDADPDAGDPGGGPDDHGPDGGPRGGGPRGGGGGPTKTGPSSTGPETTGPETTGPETTGPVSTGPVSTGPVSTGPVSTGPGNAGTEALGAESAQAGSTTADGEGAPGSGSAPDPAGESSEAPDPDRTSPPTRGLRRGTVEIRIRLSTLLGLDELPGQVPGWGPVLAGTARSMVDAMHEAEWRLVITDATGRLRHVLLVRHRPDRPTGRPPDRSPHPAGGRAGPSAPTSPRRSRGIVEIQTTSLLLTGPPPGLFPAWAGVLSWARDRLSRLPAEGSPDDGPDAATVADRRRASTELDRWVRVRDRSCVGVGCGRPARACDLDHTRDWALSGPTAGWNLDALCRHDHRAKHVGGWTLVQSEPGEFVWTSRAGCRYQRTVRPVTRRLPPPMPLPPGGRRLLWVGPPPRDGWLGPPGGGRPGRPDRPEDLGRPDGPSRAPRTAGSGSGSGSAILDSLHGVPSAPPPDRAADDDPPPF